MALPVLTQSDLADLKEKGKLFVYTLNGVELVDAEALAGQPVGLTWDPEVGSMVHVPPAFEDKLPKFYWLTTDGSVNVTIAGTDEFSDRLPESTMSSMLDWLAKEEYAEEFVLPMTVGGEIGGQWSDWSLISEVQKHILDLELYPDHSFRKWAPGTPSGKHPLLTPLYADFAQLYEDSEAWRSAASLDRDFGFWYVHGYRI